MSRNLKYQWLAGILTSVGLAAYVISIWIPGLLGALIGIAGGVVLACGLYFAGRLIFPWTIKP